MNLWSLAPHQLPARPKQTRFHRQKPWPEEIKRWLSAGFLRREGLGMHPVIWATYGHNSIRIFCYLFQLTEHWYIGTG